MNMYSYIVDCIHDLNIKVSSQTGQFETSRNFYSLCICVAGGGGGNAVLMRTSPESELLAVDKLRHQLVMQNLLTSHLLV